MRELFLAMIFLFLSSCSNDRLASSGNLSSSPAELQSGDASKGTEQAGAAATEGAKASPEEKPMDCVRDEHGEHGTCNDGAFNDG